MKVFRSSLIIAVKFVITPSVILYASQLDYPVKFFDRISFLPDPMPQNDGHYKEFKDIFGTETTEDHMPSLQKRLYREKSVPFPVTLQHARNTNMGVQCEACGVWRIVYSKHNG